MSHTIAVTRIFEDPTADTEDPEYTIGGTHDFKCEVYYPCDKAWHRHPKTEPYGGDEWGNDRVGRHQYIDGEWMVPNPHQCGLSLAFEYDNPEWRMTKLGTFDVEVQWDGDWWLADLYPTKQLPQVAGTEDASA